MEEKIMTENEKTKQWIEKLKKECEGLSIEQLKEITYFTKYKAWCAINEKFKFIDGEDD